MQAAQEDCHFQAFHLHAEELHWTTYSPSCSPCLFTPSAARDIKHIISIQYHQQHDLASISLSSVSEGSHSN